MDHSKHTPLRVEELDPATIEGASVYDPNDDHIGDISHFHGPAPAAEAVVDVGGFLGIGERPVALPASSMKFMRDEAGRVHVTTALTKDELQNLPEHKD